ncbi:MAG TPA: glycosyltransferase [Bryobacteraceae bacterium]|nr:glycosyltransferase [Bryobacteraceae bacterium]
MESPSKTNGPGAGEEPRLDVSFLVCTYNRAADLRELLASLREQDTAGGSVSYEVVIVDNNSTDETAAVIADFRQQNATPVRTGFEPRQGKGYALNTALQLARGTVCAIADDDLVLPREYVQILWKTFCAHPQVSLVGGRILPQWKGAAPAWLTADHYAAIALSNFGDQPFFTGKDRPVCLLAAAFRKDDLLRVGEYRAGIGVSGRVVVGGIEDAEIYDRMYRASMQGFYQPELSLYHKVEADRMAKSYHRKWHRARGRHYAMARFPEFDVGAWHFAGVPSHFYRSTLKDLFRWAVYTAAGRPEAFKFETNLWFFWGYVQYKLQK